MNSNVYTLLIAVSCLIATSSVDAHHSWANAQDLPSCTQIVPDDPFCEQYDGWQCWIYWNPAHNPSCPSNTRGYKCYWRNIEDPEREFYQPSLESGNWLYCHCTGGGCDCLLGGTRIAMTDGTVKRIEEIVAGDRLMSYGSSLESSKMSEVSTVHPSFTVDHYYVINDVLKVTDHHPVLSGGRWIDAGNLTTSDSLTDANGNPVSITSIRRVERRAVVYNIAVSSGTYIAEGVVVHNKENCNSFTAYCDICDEP